LFPFYDVYCTWLKNIRNIKERILKKEGIISDYETRIKSEVIITIVIINWIKESISKTNCELKS
jgi:hypothetical protein